jgi:hypothetical protein
MLQSVASCKSDIFPVGSSKFSKSRHQSIPQFFYMLKAALAVKVHREVLAYAPFCIPVRFHDSQSRTVYIKIRGFGDISGFL